MSSFHQGMEKEGRHALSTLDNIRTTLADSHWPSGILFYTVCFQGIFPVWTRGRKRREKDLIRIEMSTAKNKGVSKISSSGPRYCSLKGTLGKGDSLNKKQKY